jgi:hypothetical protein
VQTRLSSTMERKAGAETTVVVPQCGCSTLGEDGDLFDAVLDTVGGKEVRGERLLRPPGSDGECANPREGVSTGMTLKPLSFEGILHGSRSTFAICLRAVVWMGYRSIYWVEVYG